jgi:hypothetical protein
MAFPVIYPLPSEQLKKDMPHMVVSRERCCGIACVNLTVIQMTFKYFVRLGN